MAVRPKILPESQKMLAPLDNRHKRRRKAFYTAMLVGLLASFWDTSQSHELEYSFASLSNSLTLLILCLQACIYDWMEKALYDLKFRVELIWMDHLSEWTESRSLLEKVSKECKILHYIVSSPLLSVFVIYTYGILEYVTYLIKHGHIPHPSELTRFIYMSFPFIDINVSPIYEITFICTLLFITTMIRKLAALNGFILGLVSHITALHYSIIAALGKIESPGNDNQRLLKACVEKQTKLLRIVSQLQDTMPFFLFAVFSCSAIVLGLSLFAVTMELNNQSLRFNGLAICILMILTMFLYSWKSQKLIDAANDLSFAYYNTPWYNERVEFGKMVLSAMQSLENPMGLSVFYYQLHNELFGQLFSKAVSYFTIFNTLAENNSNNN